MNENLQQEHTHFKCQGGFKLTSNKNKHSQKKKKLKKKGNLRQGTHTRLLLLEENEEELCNVRNRPQRLLPVLEFQGRA